MRAYPGLRLLGAGLRPRMRAYPGLRLLGAGLRPRMRADPVFRLLGSASGPPAGGPGAATHRRFSIRGHRRRVSPRTSDTLFLLCGDDAIAYARAPHAASASGERGGAARV